MSNCDYTEHDSDTNNPRQGGSSKRTPVRWKKTEVPYTTNYYTIQIAGTWHECQVIRVPEDVPVLDGVRVAEGVRIPEYIGVPEGLRVPENIRVPGRFRLLEGFRVLGRKKLKLPDPTRLEKMFYPQTLYKAQH